MELSVGYDAIPNIKNYEKFSDKELRVANHGVIAVYIKTDLASHVFDTVFNECYISFRLDFIPQFLFIGAYIQPKNSKYFSVDMFCDLSSLLISSRERKLLPIMGGDINCRYGNLNVLFHKSSLHYADNVDITSNNHGLTYGADLCAVGDIFPINHLSYRNKQFPGDLTYFKGEKKSQLDFAYTCKQALQFIRKFEIHKENWHISDHRSIAITMSAPKHISCANLLRRAKDANYEFDPHLVIPKRFLSNYNFTLLENFLQNNFADIENGILHELDNNNINNAFIVLDKYLSDAHHISKIKIDTKESVSTTVMENANVAFVNYCNCLAGGSDEDKRSTQALYQSSRKAVTKEMYIKEQQRWESCIRGHEPKKLWGMINWKGTISKNQAHSPTTEDLAVYFENLYGSVNPDDLDKIDQLRSNTYIPVLDDPITNVELDQAVKKMKNGGYDYKVGVIDIVSKVMSPLLLILLNIMFFVSYPVNLAISLLTAIPKKGNSILPQNYRGIQMLPLFGAIFDRIITYRLNTWIGVSNEQSAYQKGKSTLHQLFVMRLIIELAKKTDTTIYIGLFDLEKAFDKISRFRMLRKLVALGIGNCMLQAMKRLYALTFCILNHREEFSDKFRTYTGIRQGAASSAHLFIVFIDDLITFLKLRCVEEPLIGMLHSLLHADDTAILSTNRDLFVRKCNLMLEYFTENTLSLNLSKSAYLIINGKSNDPKRDIILENGKLEYKPVVTYLGAKISDTGSIKQDIDYYTTEKRANVTIKFNNFCKKNFLAPLSVKLKVLDSCVSSSLVYACETWGDCKIEQIETLYRQGIKSALSVRMTTNNEIVYLESGLSPLIIRVKRQQLKFWLAIQHLTTTDPHNHISKLVRTAVDKNLNFIEYYENLRRDYETPKNCQTVLVKNFHDTLQQKVRGAATADKDSKLGAYFDVNPNFVNPNIKNCFELDRITMSRYRSGSHNLKIESGRFYVPKLNREFRTCLCNNFDLQTLRHCLLSCSLLNDLREKYDITSVEQAMSDPSTAKFLNEMESVVLMR